MPYRAVIQGWHDFFIVSGTAAATLVGLLFVGLSLHLRIVLSRDEVRSLARVTLANLGLVVIIAMFMVIPQGIYSVRYELLFSAIVVFIQVGPSFVAAQRSPTRALGRRIVQRRLGFSAGVYVALVVTAFMYSTHSFRTALSMLVGIVVALVVISLRTSWDLLVRVGEVALGETTGVDPA